MYRVLRKYVINFWIWWYVVEHKRVFVGLIGYWSFTLGYLNVLPMLQNLFVPLYQDNSGIGKVISFFIRSNWVFWGSIFQLIITIPLVLVYLCFLILPLVPLYGILSFLGHI